jgi:hypothetical protein
VPQLFLAKAKLFAPVSTWVISPKWRTRQKKRKSSVSEGRLADRTHGLANRPQKCGVTWREAPVPVIAAAHGFALGGGFQIFMGA